MTWEYRKLNVAVSGCWDAPGQSSEHGIVELNRLGREGWEITRIIPLAEGCGLTQRVIFLLRRESLRHVGAAAALAACSSL